MKLRVISLAVVLVFAFAHSAVSGAIAGGPPAFRLGASSSVGGDTVTLTPTLTPNPDGSFSASGGTTQSSFSLVFNVSLNADPSMSGSFTLVNLSSATQTFTVSATLGVLPLAGPTRMSGFFGDTTYSDTNDGSGVGDGMLGFGANPFYQAQIDGSTVQVLGSFAFTAISSDPGVVGMLSKETFGTPIPTPGPGVASSIGVSFPGFELTAHDMIEVPFEFVVVPEPSLAALLAVAAAVILFTFARDKASGGARRSGRILPTSG
jgi:hypothetical protein